MGGDDVLKRGFSGVVLLLMVIVALGCGNSSPRQSQIRIGYFPNLTHAQALVGKADGTFQRSFGKSHQVKWMQFNAGFSEVEALLAGDLDIGYIGPGPAIGGFLKSQGGLQIVAGAVDGGAILLARKDAEISNPGDLTGKRVAVPQFGNTQDLLLRQLLSKYGLKSTANGGTVDILQAENSDIKTYLARGYIDAALLPEPWGSRLIKEVGAKVVLDYNRIFRDGRYPASVVVVRTAFLKEHPDLVEKFLAAHIKLTREIKQYPDTAKKSVNLEIKQSTGKALPQGIIDSAFQRLIFTYFPESDGVQEFINILVSGGYVRESPALGKLINPNPLNRVIGAQD